MAKEMGCSDWLGLAVTGQAGKLESQKGWVTYPRSHSRLKYASSDPSSCFLSDRELFLDNQCLFMSMCEPFSS